MGKGEEKDEIGGLAEVLRMLANPIRLKMLAYIAVRPRHAYELSKKLGLSYPLTHMHLRALERLGLVESEVVEEARAKRVYKLRDFRIVISPEELRKLGEKLESG